MTNTQFTFVIRAAIAELLVLLPHSPNEENTIAVLKDLYRAATAKGLDVADYDADIARLG